MKHTKLVTAASLGLHLTRDDDPTPSGANNNDLLRQIGIVVGTAVNERLVPVLQRLDTLEARGTPNTPDTTRDTPAPNTPGVSDAEREAARQALLRGSSNDRQPEAQQQNNAPLYRSSQSLDAGERIENIRNSPAFQMILRARPEMVRTVGNVIRGVAAQRAFSLDSGALQTYVRDRFGDESAANHFRALNTQSGGAGGVLVPLEFATEFINLLYANLVLSGLGARRTRLRNGKKRMKKIITGAVPGAVPEGQNIRVREPSFGYVDLTAKDIAVIVPLTNDLLMDSDEDANAIVVADLVIEMALELERQALYGAGGAEILGLVNYAIGKTNGTSGSGSAKSDLQTIDGKYWDTNTRNTRTALLGHPRLKVWAKYITTTTGDFLFRDELAQGQFNGYAWQDTTQVPYNSGTGATQLLMGDWNEFVIGDSMETQITTSQDATIIDQNGNTLNAFQANMTFVRALQRVDAAPTYEQVFQLLSIPNLNNWLWQ
jgi:HK97 family phage major capsid protein